MLSQAEEDVLATCYRHLQERPIEPGHPFYVEIWEHSDHDPIQRLRKHILWTDFKPSVEDAHWLDKIHREQAADPQTAKAADVNRFMRLLDSHMILLYKNETSWYESLPLIREEVDRILASNREPVTE
ncbi:MAG TPA: hypothetical protein VHU83_24180 [Bryobacteraceae bacterium]|jgi:hypothetical protein|nr:hypothetical protein [Bryobacteraceae bacterium]